jgi:hypothetical protein
MQGRPKVSFDSLPLANIADIIAQRWLLRPFSNTFQNNGLLDYSQVPQADSAKTPRLIHGYQNACRVAALIEVLFSLYKDHAIHFPLAIQEEIKLLTPSKLKIIQVVGLMRCTGRTRDDKSGRYFSEQGKKECAAFLLELGLSEQESELYSDMIIQSEYLGNAPHHSLGTALLADATLLETIRDGKQYDTKRVPFANFRFFRLLNRPLAIKPIEDLIQLCCNHAQVIKKHTGFLNSAITAANGLPVGHDWPLTVSDEVVDKIAARIKQNNLEHSPNCFSLCLSDVLSANKKRGAHYTNFVKPERLIRKLFDFLASTGTEWNTDDNSAYIAAILQFMSEHKGTLLNVDDKNVRLLDGNLTRSFLITTLGNRYYEYFNQHPYRAFVDTKTNIYYLGYETARSASVGEQYLQLMSLLKNKHIKKIEKIEGSKTWYLLALDKRTLPHFHQVSFQPFSEEFCEKQKELQNNSHYLLPKYRLVKSVRFDEGCFIDEFLNGVFASAEQPDRSRLRIGPHKRFTVTPAGIRERYKKPSPYRGIANEELAIYSKHQSTTLVTDQVKPKVFSHNIKTDKVVGFIFDADSALINRAFMSNIGSLTRPYESRHANKPKLATFFEKNFKEKTYYKLVDGHYEFNMDEFLKAVANNKSNNEVMAKLRWVMQTTAVGIFSDSFEAKCIAMVYAAKSQKKLKKLLQRSGHDSEGELEIPITYYLPSQPALCGTQFTPEQQQQLVVECDAILKDGDRYHEKLSADNFEFLMLVSNTAKALAATFKTQSVILILLNKGLFHIADYIFARTGLPGTLVDYIRHQLQEPDLTGYRKEFINESMLVYAAAKGRLNIVTLVLQQHPGMINGSKNGCTALNAAVCFGHVEIVRYLLSLGAKLDIETSMQNDKKRNGKKPLHFAVLYGFHQIAQLLVDAGPVAESERDYRLSLLPMAARNDDMEMLKILCKVEPERDQLNANRFLDYVSAIRVTYAWSAKHDCVNARLYLSQQLLYIAGSATNFNMPLLVSLCELRSLKVGQLFSLYLDEHQLSITTYMIDKFLLEVYAKHIDHEDIIPSLSLALIHYAGNKHGEFIDFITKHASQKIPAKTWRTAFLVAVKHGFKPTVQELMKANRHIHFLNDNLLARALEISAQRSCYSLTYDLLKLNVQITLKALEKADNNTLGLFLEFSHQMSNNDFDNFLRICDEKNLVLFPFRQDAKECQFLPYEVSYTLAVIRSDHAHVERFEKALTAMARDDISKNGAECLLVSTYHLEFVLRAYIRSLEKRESKYIHPMIKFSGTGYDKDTKLKAARSLELFMRLTRTTPENQEEITQAILAMEPHLGALNDSKLKHIYMKVLTTEPYLKHFTRHIGDRMNKAMG